MKKESSTTRALKKFVATVDATGGVQVDEKGFYAPVGDPDWIDLGEAYIQACAVLRRAPQIHVAFGLPSRRARAVAQRRKGK